MFAINETNCFLFVKNDLIKECTDVVTGTDITFVSILSHCVGLKHQIEVFCSS